MKGKPEGVRELRQGLREVDAEEAQAALRHSLAGRMGVALEPLGSLCGFDWRTNVALVGGFAAKEVIVSTFGTAFSLGEVDPEESTSSATIWRRTPAGIRWWRFHSLSSISSTPPALSP